MTNVIGAAAFGNHVFALLSCGQIEGQAARRVVQIRFHLRQRARISMNQFNALASASLSFNRSPEE